MVRILLAGSSLIISTFIYCSLVIAKKSDEIDLKKEEKLNWKKWIDDSFFFIFIRTTKKYYF